MKKVSSGLWGLVLVLLGVALGVNALGIVDINFFPGGGRCLLLCRLIGLIGNDDKGRTRLTRDRGVLIASVSKHD